jgi:hypothetical protein
MGICRRRESFGARRKHLISKKMKLRKIERIFYILLIVIFIISCRRKISCKSFDYEDFKIEEKLFRNKLVFRNNNDSIVFYLNKKLASKNYETSDYLYRHPECDINLEVKYSFKKNNGLYYLYFYNENKHMVNITILNSYFDLNLKSNKLKTFYPTETIPKDSKYFVKSITLKNKVINSFKTSDNRNWVCDN